MNRKDARESLMQLLFQMDAQNDFGVVISEKYIIEYVQGSDQEKYFRSVLKAFKEHKDEIDSLIEKNSNGWKLGRIAKVDLAVLRLSIAESRFCKEENVPENISISEAVVIAKKYGEEGSGKFVNGILGSIARNNG